MGRQLACFYSLLLGNRWASAASAGSAPTPHLPLLKEGCPETPDPPNPLGFWGFGHPPRPQHRVFSGSTTHSPGCRFSVLPERPVGAPGGSRVIEEGAVSPPCPYPLPICHPCRPLPPVKPIPDNTGHRGKRFAPGWVLLTWARVHGGAWPCPGSGRNEDSASTLEACLECQPPSEATTPFLRKAST